MSKLEDIVPPLELCKRIPAGEFEKSVLVWVFDHQKARKYFPETQEDNQFFYIENREFVEDTIMSFAKCGVGNWINRPPMISAPTLSEIMAEVDGGVFRVVKNFFNSEYVATFITDSGIHRYCYIGKPEDAALRLWLKVKGNGDE